MKIIGLTGSMAMGKTTVAKMFSDLGCPVFNADAVVHELYSAGGKGARLINAVFSDAIKNGSVDRVILSQHMRADPLNLPVLESFIHPWVKEKRADFIRQAQEAHQKLAIFDMPLLFETGSENEFDDIIVVTAPEHIQQARIMKREGMSQSKLEMLLSRQMPDKEKQHRANYIISTAKGFDNTREQVKEVHAKILAS